MSLKKREKQVWWQQLEEEEEDLLVERKDETECEARLREKAHSLEALSTDLRKALDHTRVLLLNKQKNAKEDLEPIPQPQAITKFTVNEFCNLIGLPKDSNNINIQHQWLAILASVCDFMSKSGLDWELVLGAQDPGKYGRPASVIYKLVPEIQPCTNNWGAEFLLKAVFRHHCGHLQHKEKVWDKVKGK
ncbi:hypothetical protein FRC06_003223 [Ceratobasidium sp. 370]|nr:hypothetical protein FRC06_003223 [Ceratobasidium sp. 370]